MRLDLITGPTEEFITADEFKMHPSARIDTTADDAWINQFIVAARLRYEELTQRILMTSTWDLYLDRFPALDSIERETNRYVYGSEILLPAPLISVTSVKYQDLANVQQTLDPGNYSVDIKSAPAGRIALMYGYLWPLTYYTTNAVVVRFQSGYAAQNVPAHIKNYLCFWIAATYDGNQTIIDWAENNLRGDGRIPV